MQRVSKPTNNPDIFKSVGVGVQSSGPASLEDGRSHLFKNLIQQNWNDDVDIAHSWGGLGEGDVVCSDSGYKDNEGSRREAWVRAGCKGVGTISLSVRNLPAFTAASAMYLGSATVSFCSHTAVATGSLPISTVYE